MRKRHDIPQLERSPPGEPPFLANLPERCSNLLYKRRPCIPFFFLSNSVSPCPLFFGPSQHIQQNSLLFHRDAPFSGRPCHHLLVVKLDLLPTTRQKMPSAQSNLPSINVNTSTDMHKTSLPNLSYPIRPIHTWVDSSVPLVITARYLPWAL